MTLTQPLYQGQAAPASGRPGSPRIAPADPGPGGQARAGAGQRRALARPKAASRTYLPPAIQRVLARAAALHLLPLLNLIASRAAGGEACTASQRELGAELGRTDRQVRRGELELERLGLLEIRRGGPRNRRALSPTWFRAVPEPASSPQVLHRPDTDVWSRGGETGHACPVSAPPERAGLLTRSRAPARTQTENLLVYSGGRTPRPDEGPTTRGQPMDVERLTAALARWADLWRNTLPEVTRLLREILAAAGEAETQAWLEQLTRRLSLRDKPQRGALLLGAIRARARQERRTSPGLFDRPLELLP